MYTDIGQGIFAGIVVYTIDLPLFGHGVRRGFWFGAHFRNFGIYCGWPVREGSFGGSGPPPIQKWYSWPPSWSAIVFFKIVHYGMVKSKLLTQSFNE